MSAFGDAGSDDTYTAGGRADPEQVARRLHDLRRELGGAHRRFEDLTPGERAVAIALMVALLAWLRREGST